ncbi:MAG: SDR family oxidoreductase [Brockia lithotrophica]|nr:SDR family oxidoreductase [Brockia lithotrophica]
MDLGLEGKTALVVGGTKGIGLAIARGLADEGARVAVAGRSAPPEDVGSRVTSFFADLEAGEAREDFARTVAGDLGDVDVLVITLGGSLGTGEFRAAKLEDFRRVMELNFFAPLHLTKLFLPGLERRKGVVLYVGSIWGLEAGGKPAYNAAKAALASLTKMAGRELLPRGVRVVGIAPGSILHPTSSWKRLEENDPQGFAAFVRANLPAGRLGTAEEVAAVAVFLVSPRASWVAATTVVVDGGQSLRF